MASICSKLKNLFSKPLVGWRFSFDVSHRKFKLASSHAFKSSDSCNGATSSAIAVQRTSLGLRFEFGSNNDHWSGSELFVDYLWLKDNCRCPCCYDDQILQRKFTGSPVSLLSSSVVDGGHCDVHVQPKSVNISGRTVYISWPNDHQSTYNVDWLRQNVFVKNEFPRLKPVIKLWNGSDLNDYGILKVAYEKETSERFVRQLLNNVVTYGFSIVEGVEPTEEATAAVVKCFAVPQETYFGKFWSVTQDAAKEDSAYSASYIPPHNDCTYFSEAPGLMIFHCLEEPLNGGQTVLVDGFYGSDQLRRSDMASYCYLSSTPIESCYLDKKGNHFIHCDTILKHHPLAHDILQIRFNPLDLVPVKTIRQDEMRTFYRAFGSLAQILWAEANKIQITLQPGTVLVLDNWRLLHSRNAFTGHRRRLYGCYVSRTEFVNSAARAGLYIS